MTTPLTVSMLELRKIAAEAADKAGTAAREAGIVPAGLLKIRRVRGLEATRRLRRQIGPGRNRLRTFKPARAGKKAVGKRIGR